MTDGSSAPSFNNHGGPGAEELAELDQYIFNDTSFPTAYLRAVASIASSDGVLNLADYEALGDVAALLNDSALAQVVLLEYIDHPVSWREALVALKSASSGITQKTASTAFEAARPLLCVQGMRSRSLAEEFAKALQYRYSPEELNYFPCNEQSIWSRVSQSAGRVLKGQKYAELSNLCVRATGDAALANSVLQFESGTLDAGALSKRLTAASVKASQEIVDFNKRIGDFEVTREISKGFLDAAHTLQKQVRQRLVISDARIAFELRTFDEDMEECIHDAGNAFERDVAERVATDAWKRAAVWESIARSTFGKELERRLNRLISRREESLSLIRQDLQLFQEELSLSRSAILKRQHHTQLSSAAPGLRLSTRLMNGVEAVADTTLKVGGATVLGAGAAAYFLGAAVVLPVVAPAAPLIGGVLLAAGAFKWLMNPSERKAGEISHQRDHFEAAFRKQIDAAREELVKQLDAMAEQYHSAAEKLVQPVLLEAQAASKLATLQLKIARKLTEHSQRALVDMLAALPCANNE